MSRLAALRVAAFNPKSSVIERGASQRFRGHVEILDQQQVTALFNFDHVAVWHVIEDDIQQRAVNFEGASVVFDEAKLA